MQLLLFFENIVSVTWKFDVLILKILSSKSDDLFSSCWNFKPKHTPDELFVNKVRQIINLKSFLKHRVYADRLFVSYCVCIKIHWEKNIWDGISLEWIIYAKIFHRNEKLDSQFCTPLFPISESLWRALMYFRR